MHKTAAVTKTKKHTQRQPAYDTIIRRNYHSIRTVTQKNTEDDKIPIVTKFKTDPEPTIHWYHQNGLPTTAFVTEHNRTHSK